MLNTQHSVTEHRTNYHVILHVT